MIGKAVGRLYNTTKNLIMGVGTSEITQKVVSKVAKAVADAVEPGAGIADKSLKSAKKGVQAATNPKTYSKIGKAVESGAGKVVNNVVTDPGSYKQIGKSHVVRSNKSLFGDEMHRRIQGGLDTVAAVATHKSKIGNKVADFLESDNKLLNIPSKMVRGVSNGLVTTGGDNLLPLGMKATGLGVVAASAVQLGAGAPDAVKQWNANRQGSNYDSQPVTSAPRTPSYANNGGATGDLVFALNNLRHGGMM